MNNEKIKPTYDEVFSAYIIASQERYKYKNVIDKIKEKVDYYKSAKYGTYDSDDILADLNYIFLELLEEVDG